MTASPLRGPGGAVAGGLEVIVDQSEAHRVAREKRLLEERVARMQRLEAVVTLAGGIAHDFNNILTYMFAYADIVQGLLPTNSAAAPHVQQLVLAIVVVLTTLRLQASPRSHPAPPSSSSPAPASTPPLTRFCRSFPLSAPWARAEAALGSP